MQMIEATNIIKLAEGCEQLARMEAIHPIAQEVHASLARSLRALLRPAPDALRVIKETLEGIANANYRTWGEGLNDLKSFHDWAKSRARFALAALACGEPISAKEALEITRGIRDKSESDRAKADETEAKEAWPIEDRSADIASTDDEARGGEEPRMPENLKVVARQLNDALECWQSAYSEEIGDNPNMQPELFPMLRRAAALSSPLALSHPPARDEPGLRELADVSRQISDYLYLHIYHVDSDLTIDEMAGTLAISLARPAPSALREALISAKGVIDIAASYETDEWPTVGLKMHCRDAKHVKFIIDAALTRGEPGKEKEI